MCSREIVLMQAHRFRSEPNVKRDMDLFRDLLLHIEADDKYDGTTEFSYDTPEELGISGHTIEEVAYHLTLLIEAGLVKGASGSGTLPTFSRLTSDGHDFLDNIRDPGVWAKVKARLDGLPGVALTAIIGIAQAEIKKKFGLD